MSDLSRLVTGVFRAPSGQVFGGRTVTIFRRERRVVAQGTSVVVDEVERTVLSAAGEIAVYLVPGSYLARIALEDVDRYFEFGVPEGSGPWAIEAAVEAATPFVSSASVAAARAEADRAESEADRAEVARDDASAVAGLREFADLEALLANSTLTYATGLAGTVSEGDVVRTRAEGWAFRVLAAGVEAVFVTAGGVGLQRERLLADPVPGNRARLALIFDDGYRNNVTCALPILRRYGFSATIAVEAERVHLDYAGEPNEPVVTAEDMREWIRAGGEICNHPALDLAASEAAMAASAVAENERLRDILTGALVWDGSGFVAGPVTHPEFLDWRVETGVYRFGSRNETSDRAFFTVFDKVRGIQGSVASFGDGIYATDEAGEWPAFWAARSVDTNGSEAALTLALSWIRSVGATGGVAVAYAHFTPDGLPGFADPPPFITLEHLEALCRACAEAGVEIVPMSALGPMNVLRGPAAWREDFWQLTAGAAGNEAARDTVERLNSLPWSLRLHSDAAVAGGNRPRARSQQSLLRPFCRYRIRVRYRIDADLVRFGNSPNHGLEVRLETKAADAPQSADLSVTNYEMTQPAPIPWEATSGWAVHETVVVSGLGRVGQVELALNWCEGTVRIGHVSLERLDSLERRPFVLEGTFAPGTSRLMRLPKPQNLGSRRWRWHVVVEDAPVEATVQEVDLAFADSADVTPAEGQTVYVLGRGAGAFAGQGGRIGTYSSGAWGAWAAPANETLIRAANGEGVVNAHYRHHRVSGLGGQFSRLFTQAFEDRAFVQRIAEHEVRVWSEGGVRSDAFRLVCQPAPL